MMKRAAAAALLFSCLTLGACHRFVDDDFINSYEATDFNADGWADIAVGAPFDDAGGPAGSNRGQVFVYRGPSTSLMASLAGVEAESRFGFASAPIGDFNGDRYPDLAVGAHLDDGDGNSTDEGDDRGRVFVYLGGPNFGGTIITLTGPEIGGEFGFAVARAGDVNKDGFDDLLVGAPFEDGGGMDRGRAYLFLGGSSPSTTPLLTFTGGEDFSRFGWAVNTAGDINNDGFFDWMIGAPRDDNDGTSTNDGWNRGRVFIYRGSVSPDNSVEVTIDGGEDAAELGYSIAGLLDVDGDFTGDIVLGAPFDDADGNPLTAGAEFGRGYFFFGSSLLFVGSTSSLSANRIFSGIEEGAMFGATVARVGDINSGGANDLFIGAPLDDGDGNTTEDFFDTGRGFIFHGGASIDTIADLVFTGQEDGAQLGWWANSGGDVDRDGHRDLVIGAPFDDGDGNATEDFLDRGRVTFYRGGPFLDATPESTLGGSGEDGAEFGDSVS